MPCPEIFTIVYLQSQQFPVAGGNFWEKINVCQKISYAELLMP